MSILTETRTEATPSTPTDSKPTPCPCFTWCDVDHVEEGFGDWHREAGMTAIEPGVLRTDHVLDENGAAHLSIAETFDWTIEPQESSEFFAKLRASIDEAERRFDRFVSQVKPLARRTEPGAPSFEESI
ncbi:hypothetical protein G7068_03190 [Leucobacter viscericola]|uniref:Uncharacterized protein n=1 Tax=Leucobacter viscericola TaxID=2714935 RepID=A0A6G7XCZ9_9MICO|nr:hypothetical protein [Leucobacter viscericola]QIK62319.1 hypothetical protein G7068_03190 [Leucobacter viscericola]